MSAPIPEGVNRLHALHFDWIQNDQVWDQEILQFDMQLMDRHLVTHSAWSTLMQAN